MNRRISIFLFLALCVLLFPATLPAQTSVTSYSITVVESNQVYSGCGTDMDNVTALYYPGVSAQCTLRSTNSSDITYTNYQITYYPTADYSDTFTKIHGRVYSTLGEHYLWYDQQTDDNDVPYWVDELGYVYSSEFCSEDQAENGEICTNDATGEYYSTYNFTGLHIASTNSGNVTAVSISCTPLSLNEAKSTQCTATGDNEIVWSVTRVTGDNYTVTGNTLTYTAPSQISSSESVTSRQASTMPPIITTRQAQRSVLFR